MKFDFIKNNIDGAKWLYKDIISGKGLSSSMRYCLVYYMTFLPALLVYGVERLKDPTIAIAYYSALTGILAALLGFKVKQFSKEVSSETDNLETNGKAE